MARMELLKGHPTTALTQLNDAKHLIGETSNRFVLLDYYLIASDVFSVVGRGDDEKAALLAAIELCENGLRSIHNERERLLWTRLDETYSTGQLSNSSLRIIQQKHFNGWSRTRTHHYGQFKEMLSVRRLTKPGGIPHRAENHGQNLTPNLAKINGETVILS